MGIIIGFSNHKGGTAKSTTVINTAGVLAERGSRVLVVDLDPQASLSLGFGVEIADLPEPSLDQVLLHPRKHTIHESILSVRDTIDIIPTNILLADAGFVLMGAQARELRLKKALAPIRDNYDYILIDSPPSKSVLTVNVLVASDYLVIPAATAFYSGVGVQLLLRSIEEVTYDLHPGLKVLGVLPTRYKTNTVESRESLSELQDNLGDDIHIFTSVIRESEPLNKAHRSAETIVEYDPKHRAAQDYRDFVTELLKEIANYE